MSSTREVLTSDFPHELNRAALHISSCARRQQHFIKLLLLFPQHLRVSISELILPGEPNVNRRYKLRVCPSTPVSWNV